MRDTLGARRLLTVGTRTRVRKTRSADQPVTSIARRAQRSAIRQTSTCSRGGCRTTAARAHVGHVTIRTVVPIITLTRAVASLPSRYPVVTCDAFCVIRTVDRTAAQRSTI